MFIQENVRVQNSRFPGISEINTDSKDRRDMAVLYVNEDAIDIGPSNKVVFKYFEMGLDDDSTQNLIGFAVPESRDAPPVKDSLLHGVVEQNPWDFSLSTRDEVRFTEFQTQRLAYTCDRRDVPDTHPSAFDLSIGQGYFYGKKIILRDKPLDDVYEFFAFYSTKLKTHVGVRSITIAYPNRGFPNAVLNVQGYNRTLPAYVNALLIDSVRGATVIRSLHNGKIIVREIWVDVITPVVAANNGTVLIQFDLIPLRLPSLYDGDFFLSNLLSGAQPQTRFELPYTKQIEEVDNFLNLNIY
jgi:hypothetical protein